MHGYDGGQHRITYEIRCDDRIRSAHVWHMLVITYEIRCDDRCIDRDVVWIFPSSNSRMLEKYTDVGENA